MATTHVAGPCISFQSLDRVIQRCAVCGYKLIDISPSKSTVCTQDEGRLVPAHTVAHLIRVDADGLEQPKDIGNFFNVKLPDDFCLNKVEVGND